MIEVVYVDHMGSAVRVVDAARVSFGNHGQNAELIPKDKKLVRYLAKHEHMSPFEHCVLTVIIKCPLYIRSQIHRHRTFSYNEISRRYTAKDLAYFTPDEIREQCKNNRQASAGNLSEDDTKQTIEEMNDIHTKCLELYEKFLDRGVPKEQARGVLPQNLMTEFFMTGNLRNWVHFIRLREHAGAQAEVQKIARLCRELIIDKFGYAGKVLLEEEGDNDQN